MRRSGTGKTIDKFCETNVLAMFEDLVAKKSHTYIKCDVNTWLEERRLRPYGYVG